MKPGDGTTVIGKPAKFRGDITSSEDLQIDGEFEGTIRVSGARLTVGSDARVRASIAAADVVVYGRIEGDIYATGRVDLRSTAVVLGDVFAARLSIEDNAALRGFVDPSRSGDPVPYEQPKPAEAPARPTYAQSPMRTPELFPTPGPQPRQMPSALAAIAAAGRSESAAITFSDSAEGTVEHETDR